MTSGEEISRNLTMRSVESRRSHRLSRRCEQEALIVVTPFENPCAERAAAVADEMRRETRGRAHPPPTPDDPAGGGGRGIGRRRRAQQQRERAAVGRRQRKP